MASGLDTLTSNILPGESGGLPTDELSTESTPSDGGLTSVKAPSVKGGFGFGSPVLDATNSAEVLKNMQKFIDERSSPYHKFISNLDDARAAAVANVHGEGTTAVNAREKQKEEEAKTIFDMQNQMAALKAAQATQARQREQLLSDYAAAHPQAGSNVVIPGSSSSPNGMPESMWEDYKQALNNNDLAGAAKIKSDWNKYTAQEGFKARTGFENSGPGRTQQTYTVKTAEGVRQVDLDPVQWSNVQATRQLPDGTPVLAAGPTAAAPKAAAPVGPQGIGLSPSDIRKVESGNKPFAVGPNVPGQGSAKSSMQVMDATSTNPGFGVKPAQLTGDKVHDEAELTRVGTDYFNALKTKYGNDTLAAAAYNMGPGSTDAWIAAGADYKKLPQETKDYIAKVHLANATSGLAKPATAAPATAAPATAAPATAAPATTTAGDNEKRAQAYWDTHPPQNKVQFDKQKSDIEEARKADVSLASEKEKERTKAK